MRARLLPDLQPAYAGYVTWRALMSESEAAPVARKVLEREYLFCVPEGSLALCYAVPARDGDLRVGYRDYNCAWYRPIDEAELAKLCTDISGKCHGTSKRVAILAAKGGRLLNPSAPSGSLTPNGSALASKV